MISLSLRARIFLSYFFLIAIAGIVICVVAARQIARTTEDLFWENFEAANNTVVGVIEDTLLEITKAGIEEEDWAVFNIIDVLINDLDEMGPDLNGLADDLGVSIQLISGNGEFVIWDTELNRGGFEQVPDPEIWELVEADMEREFAEVQYDRNESIYRAAYLFFEEDQLDERGIFIDELIQQGAFDRFDGEFFIIQPEMIVRIGDTSEQLDQTIFSRIITLGLATGVTGLILLFVLGGWLANALTRPLTDLRTTAKEMAGGRLDARAETNAPPEISALAEDFNEMATAVETMVAEQRAFASNAAHELRTPLTAIRIRTETLIEDDPDEAIQTTYINEIHSEVKRLGRLIDDLRLLSRADARNLEIGEEQVNVVNMLKALLREFSRQIEAKHLTVTIGPSLDLFVIQASGSHLRVMLRNVLENSIKYTPDGGKIEISLVRYLSGGQEINQISFKDNGMGIPEEDLPHLFERFYRVDKAHSRKIPGSGLGLSLVRSIVELYEGSIDVHSGGVGLGTTVVLELPVR